MRLSGVAVNVQLSREYGQMRDVFNRLRRRGNELHAGPVECVCTNTQAADSHAPADIVLAMLFLEHSD
jgi:hypothetical protein